MQVNGIKHNNVQSSPPSISITLRFIKLEPLYSLNNNFSLPSPCSPWKHHSEVKSLSRVRLFATPWTVPYQAPPSMGFSRQEYWSGLPFPSLGDLPNPGIKPGSPRFQADTLTSEPPGKPIYAYNVV